MPTPIENHEKWSRRFELVLSNPSKIAEMDNSKVGETVETCVGRLRRVRMGGRSTPLYVLAILLWHAHDRSPRIQVDVEELLAARVDRGQHVALNPHIAGERRSLDRNAVRIKPHGAGGVE